MLVKCIKNNYIDENNLEIHYDNDIFGNLNIGNNYTVTNTYDDGNTYFIKEIRKFVSARLFVKIEEIREEKLKKLGI